MKRISVILCLLLWGCMAWGQQVITQHPPIWVYAGEAAPALWTDPNPTVIKFHFETTNGFTTLIDYSGNGFDGTNKPSGALGVGITNLGIRLGGGDENAGIFDNIDDGIEVIDGGAIPTSGTSNFTFAAWVKISEWPGVAPDRNIIAGKNDASTAEGWWFTVEDDQYMYVGNHGNTLNVRNTTQLETNRWYHLGFKWENIDNTNANLTFYLDGVTNKGNWVGAPFIVNGVGKMLTATQPFAWGIDPRDFSGYTWAGLIDDGNLYPELLSDGEMATLHTNTFHPLGSIETRSLP